MANAINTGGGANVPATPRPTTTAPTAGAPAPAFDFTNILKDPQQAQAFAQLIAMAVMASQQLMGQYGGIVGGDPAQQKQIEEAQKQQLAYMQGNVDQLTQSTNYWKGLMSDQLNLGATVGVTVPPGGFGPAAFGPGGIFGMF